MRALANSPGAGGPGATAPPGFRWLTTGRKALEGMIESIESAQSCVRLEMYIFTESPIADKFRDALTRAQERGVRVQVLLDAVGSFTLPGNYWNALTAAGGQLQWFNPLSLRRISLRDHRKILVCDTDVAFVGGFNISTEYEGDGVTSGWRDLGLRIAGPLVRELSGAFDETPPAPRPRFARCWDDNGTRGPVSGVRPIEQPHLALRRRRRTAGRRIRGDRFGGGTLGG